MGFYHPFWLLLTSFRHHSILVWEKYENRSWVSFQRRFWNFSINSNIIWFNMIIKRFCIIWRRSVIYLHKKASRIALNASLKGKTIILAFPFLFIYFIARITAKWSILLRKTINSDTNLIVMTYYFQYYWLLSLDQVFGIMLANKY